MSDARLATFRSAVGADGELPADVLREGLDGVVGVDENAYLHGLGEEFWSKRRAVIERAARSTRT